MPTDDSLACHIHSSTGHSSTKFISRHEGRRKSAYHYCLYHGRTQYTGHTPCFLTGMVPPPTSTHTPTGCREDELAKPGEPLLETPPHNNGSLLPKYSTSRSRIPTVPPHREVMRKSCAVLAASPGTVPRTVEGTLPTPV